MRIFLAVLLGAILWLNAAPSYCYKEAVITFTFDDGSETIFTNAFPVLEKYNFPATLYPVTKYIGIDSWYINWNQVAVLGKRGWEIGSHSHTHPNMTELSDEEIIQELESSTRILREHGFIASSYASPFGEFNERVLRQVKSRFLYHRKAWGKVWDEINESGPEFNQYEISAVELKQPMKFEDVKPLIDRAVEEKKWLVFLLHGVVKTNPQEFQFSAGELEKIADYINNHKLKVTTLSGYFEKRRK